MTDKEKNRLIEKFMGWELKWSDEEGYRGWSFHNTITNEYLHRITYCDSFIGFTTDWNWLIQALKKFDTLLEQNLLNVNIVNFREYSKICDHIDYAVTLYEIDDAINALCEGIEWYNSTLN